MTQMLDCMVNYFGLDEDERPGYRRYLCYHIVAGPGPTEGSGVASITTVAIYDDSERRTYCQHLHAVDTGGPGGGAGQSDPLSRLLPRQRPHAANPERDPRPLR